MMATAEPWVLHDDELRALVAHAPWRRVVILGDSTAEGVREPLEGWRDESWTDRIVHALPPVQVLNLGRRNLLAAKVREQQLDAALAFEPDLAIVSAGGNDTLRRSFDPDAVADELDAIVGALRAAGADVLMLELMDIVAAGLAPAAYRRPSKALAGVTREVARRRGAMLVEMRHHPACADPGVYASDRLHLNARGHAIVGTEAIRTLGRAIEQRRAA